MNHELPEGWLEVAIGNIAKVIGGGTPKSSDQSNFAEPGSGIPWLTPADLSGYTAKEISNGRRDLTAVGYENSSATVMPKGSLLFSSRAPIGYVAIASNEISTNQGFKSFVFSQGVHPSYAYYYLKSIKDLANERGSGSTFRELSGSAAKNLPFLLAPLPEQIRIADKLDRILARVNAAQARLDKIPALIKRFRQAVLAEATSGELTREWRDNTECDWDRVALKDVATGFNYGSSSKSKKSGDVPVLRMGNIQGGKLDWSDLVYTSDKDEIEKYKLKPGDVLFNRTNSPELVGKTSIYRGERDSIYAGYLIRIRGGERLDNEFLNMLLNSPAARDYCWKVKTDGVSQSNINAKKIQAFEFDLPLLEEQLEIVRRVESLFSLADTVEKQYRAAKARTDRLTQASLAKAFRGELVPQDPDDEPADVLLERIQAQRAEYAAAPKKRKPKTKAGSKKTAQSGPEAETSRKTRTGKQSSKVINVTQSVTSSDGLLSLLKELGEESVGVDASTLWKNSGLSIDDFYALLKQTEQIEDHIPSSDPAQRKLRVRK